MKLNKEEKEILNAYEKGNLKSIKNVKKETNKYRKYEKYTLQKNKRINIRISEKDLSSTNTYLKSMSFQTKAWSL